MGGGGGMEGRGVWRRPPIYIENSLELRLVEVVNR